MFHPDGYSRPIHAEIYRGYSLTIYTSAEGYFGTLELCAQSRPLEKYFPSFRECLKEIRQLVRETNNFARLELAYLGIPDRREQLIDSGFLPSFPRWVGDWVGKLG